MSLKKLKKFVKSLQKGSLAPVVGVLATIQQSLKHRTLVHIFVDSDGDWHRNSKGSKFVATDLFACSYCEVEKSVIDQWCYDYKLKAGDIVIDIGAGIGDDVLAFSKLVGSTGRVVAIEAHPRTFRCLVKTIELNNLKNVTPVNIAVSDRDGVVGMSDGENYQANSIVSGDQAVHVKARRLDDILKELDFLKPSLVKINIEGAETRALLGMKEVLRDLPHIAVSCHDFIADGGGDPELRTYDDVKKILEYAEYNLRASRKDHRPWFPYYLYGSKRQ